MPGLVESNIAAPLRPDNSYAPQLLASSMISCRPSLFKGPGSFKTQLTINNIEEGIILPVKPPTETVFHASVQMNRL